MRMPISWQYTDIYGVIIWYIADHLDSTSYLLNFGIIAINESHPKVIIRFTLKNIRNNLSKSWTQATEGETLEDLFDRVFAVVEMHKIDVCYFYMQFVKIFVILCFRYATECFFWLLMPTELFNT